MLLALKIIVNLEQGVLILYVCLQLSFDWKYFQIYFQNSKSP